MDNKCQDSFSTRGRLSQPIFSCCANGLLWLSHLSLLTSCFITEVKGVK